MQLACVSLNVIHLSYCERQPAESSLCQALLSPKKSQILSGLESGEGL